MEMVLKRINENKIMINEEEVKFLAQDLHPYYKVTGQYGDWDSTPIDCEWDYLVLVFKDIRDDEEYAVPILKNDRLKVIGPMTFVEQDEYDVLEEDPQSPLTADKEINLDTPIKAMLKSTKTKYPVCVKKSYFDKMQGRMDVFCDRLID